jgi:GNAT superfamily N-acetyltransferase
MKSVAFAIREISRDEIASTAWLRREMMLELDNDDLDKRVPVWRERYVKFFDDLIAAGKGALLVAEADGAMVGLTAVYKPADYRNVIYGRQSAIISHVYVVPASRKRGIASALTMRAVQWAKDSNCIVIRLRSSKQGRPVYEKLGFKPSDEMELRLKPEHRGHERPRTP